MKVKRWLNLNSLNALKMKIKPILIALLFGYFLTIISCSEKTRNISQILDRVSLLMDIYPDSSFTILDSIQGVGSLDNKLYNRYQLLYIQAKDKQYKDITSDSAIFQVQKYYQTTEDIPSLTLASFYCGRLLQEKKEFKEAASFYIQAENYAEQNSNTYLKGLIQYYLGTIYYDQLMEEEAIDYYKKAIFSFNNIGKKTGVITAYNQLGNCYLMQQKNDSAFFFYRKSLFLADSIKNNALISAIRQNVGFALAKSGKHAEAIPYFKEALKYVNSDSGYGRIYCNMAESFYNQQKNDSARFYINKALILPNIKNDSYQMLGIYKLLSLINKQDHDYREALSNHEQYVRYQDLIFEENEAESIREIQKKYDYELIKNEHNNLLIEKQYGIITVLILVLCLFSLGFIFHSKLQKSRKEKNEAQRKIIYFNDLVEDLQKQENILKLKLLQHFDVIKKSVLLEQYLENNNSSQGKSLLKKFNGIIYENHPINWDTLYDAISDKYNGFPDALRKTYPELELIEFRICCLLYTGFSNTEMSIILSLSTSSITAKRSSIRKKIGLKVYSNIVEHLNKAVFDQKLSSSN